MPGIVHGSGGTSMLTTSPNPCAHEAKIPASQSMKMVNK